MKKASKFLLVLAFCLWMVPSWGHCASGIKDAESATHAADASAITIVDTYAFPDFKVIQFELPVLSVYSYLLISDGEGLLVDPVRDVFFFLETAQKENVRIQGVYLTHSHADFIAGHTEMVKKTGCVVYQSRKSGATYPFEPLGEGTEIRIGKAVVKFVETPGHTPDGMCAQVFGGQNPGIPELMFTGDVLFVGSVGRPDLIGGDTSAAWLASAMFDSWNNKLAKLDDTVKVFPAHGAGSLCGAHLSDEPMSTVGKERTSNPYLRHEKRGEFIASLLEGLPEAPQYFRHNARINREGPPAVNWEPGPQNEIAPSQELADTEQHYVVDLRSAADYASGHIPNAVNIALRGRVETWTGIMVPWEAKLVLCGSMAELKEAAFRLNRIGYSGDIITPDAWKSSGLPMRVGSPITPAELRSQMEQGSAPVIVDVRLPSEWMAVRIGTILNLPLNRLSELSKQLNPSEPVVLVCNSAYRSSMAVGVLERKGFKSPRNLEGGSEAWIKAGYPVYEAVKSQSGTTAAPKTRVRLPESISASALKRLMMDLPGTFDLLDIRPPDHFRDYSLSGSVNADVSDVISNPAHLAGAVPLILVDRDGSVAMAVGGILSQKTERPIKVLYGGLEAYWTETEGISEAVRSGSGPKGTTALPAIRSVPKASPSAPSSPPESEPPKPKKKSAGC